MSKIKIVLSLLVSLYSISLFSQTNTCTILLNKEYPLTSTIETFNEKNHKIDTCFKEEEWQSICLIDDKLFYGLDMGLQLQKTD